MPQTKILSGVAKSTFCLNFVRINQPHVDFWSGEFTVNVQAFTKLSAKLESYLIGDLKSFNNLQRFYEEFFNWKEELAEHDCLAQRIVDLCFSTMCVAIDSLIDEECNDIEFVIAGTQELFDEMQELGCDADVYRDQFMQFTDAAIAELQATTQRPVSRDCIARANISDATLFGL